MASLLVSTGCYWILPSGSITVLERPPPGDYDSSQASVVDAISDNGSVIVGVAIEADQVTKHAARWDNGVMTLLKPLSNLGQDVFPTECSADGSVIVGGRVVQSWGYWTGGGTTAAILQSTPGGVLAVGPQGVRALSSDGHVIVGTSAATQGTRWVNGVPSSVVGHYNASQVIGCSADGNTLIGDGSGNPLSSVGYWRAPDLNYRPTVMTGPASSLGIPYPRAVNANGTVIWSDTIYEGGYTDNLDTAASGIYGTFHQWVPPAGASFVRNSYYAEDTFSPNPIAVGFCHFGSYPNDYTRSTRTTGTTTVLLDMGSYTNTAVRNVSGSGQIVVGSAIDSTGTKVPCYWDAAGSIHALPVPNGWVTLGATAISRNGAVVLGIISKTIEIPDPPPPPLEITLGLVSVYPQDLPANRFSLYSDAGADFPPSFGKYTLSMWCCEGVAVQWPGGLLRATPTQCYAEFHDSSGILLFSGTFLNPNPNPPDFYKLSFAIDTEAGSVVCYGDNTAWNSTDAVFASLGKIGNVDA